MFQISAPAPIRIRLYGQKEVDETMAVLDRHDYFSEILAAEGIDYQCTGRLLFEKYWRDVRETSNQNPEYFTDMDFIMGENAAQLEIGSEMDATQFLRYLSVNGGWSLRSTKHDGNCFWSSIRRGLDIPAEFTNMHLKRWIVIRALWGHAKFFYKILKDEIAVTYGRYRYSPDEISALKKKGQYTDSIKDEQDMPGPFSFKTYMQHLLEPNTWGDNICLLMFCLLTNTSATILNIERRTEIRCRHNFELKDVDLLLLHGERHFQGAGKFVFHKITHLRNEAMTAMTAMTARF